MEFMGLKLDFFYLSLLNSTGEASLFHMFVLLSVLFKEANVYRPEFCL